MKQQIFIRFAAMLLLISCFATAFAQETDSTKPNVLADTKWTGIVNAPSPEMMTFAFSENMLNLLYQGETIETMSYTVDRDTLTLKKTSGGSPCSLDSVGSYTFSINDNKLTFTLVKDDCNERAIAFDPNGYTLVK